MRIAIVKLSALGDIIHAMIVLQFIKNHYPESIIDWFVEESFKGIIENNPHINKIHTISFKKTKQAKSIRYLLKEILRLRKLEKYDLVIDIQNLIKSAIISVKNRKLLGFSSIRVFTSSVARRLKVATRAFMASSVRQMANPNPLLPPLTKTTDF